MGRQPRLVLLLLLTIGVFHVTLGSTPRPIPQTHDDYGSDQLDSDEEGSADIINSKHDSKDIKLSSEILKDVPKIKAKTSTTSGPASTSSTTKPVSDEIMKDLLEASKHSSVLADDLRLNKMLPDKFLKQNATTPKVDSEQLDDYDANYEYGDEDYNYVVDFDSTESNPKKITPTNKDTEASIEMKPIKEVNESTSKSNNTNTHDDIDNNIEHEDEKDNKNNDNTDEDDYSDEVGDDGEEDIADEEDVIFSENVPCPRYCVCARNINSYLVATCSRFDPGTQKFGSDITDLVVTDIGPKYPILLGPEFFLQMGLKRVSTIKIANCTIEYLHPTAFHGLEELYSVNLTNVGLSLINPDTFAKNKKLRMLTISGNDLGVMSSVHYLIKSSSIEELDLSGNNLMELNPHAFSQLSNIVYINLSQNNLQTIPEKVFDNVETIEELDLSYNSLKTLPPLLFNRTALAILNLKYNSITNDLKFGTSDLQQLDLSFNLIHAIHHGMFDKMTGLTNLNLKGNGVTKIQPDSFLTLKNLRHIDLSINELEQVSSMLFYKNSELDVIRMNDNPRLSQLPTDGFQSYNGYFTVYFLDISNCAIGSLGHKTFSTMPHLATLKLAWNNINNLERDTFSSLNKLIELDLSNNLIAKLDELLFMDNNDLTKLNLAGNPMRKLSVRLFLPMTKLRELDVSDCELSSLLIDNRYGVGRKYKFYETLRSFNASANQIRKISSFDIRHFKNLRTLDITNNPLKCNEGFQEFMNYVTLNTYITPNKMPTFANIESDATNLDDFRPNIAGWVQLAQEVCKHHESMAKSTNNNKVETRIQEVEKSINEDEKNLLGIVKGSHLNKLQKILKDSSKDDESWDDYVEEDDNDDEYGDDDKNDKDNAEDNEDEEDNTDNDEEEDEEDEEDEDDYDADDNKQDELDLSKIKDHGVKVEEINLSKETKDPFLLNKFSINGEEQSNDNVDEEIIIERGRIYYGGYRFLVPVIVTVLCIAVVLLIVVKLIVMMLHKRGERYRMALLASSNNSIVYQKLSEEIKPKMKESKQPKVHRYAPINQV
ncbi:protein PFC0760c [Teleopsis dalmanni]|uniref:protein PFC0760c n=1 Tax=Teleopsis dalmanni TaxID=139649 RepID=UPI0018CEDE87|nr:protein PFC0760c [Teleopsis dalmanni]XP_037943814.1 protein PFC0760c [Teleopsis dalmanni]